MLLVSHGCETLEFVENIGYSKPYDSTNPILLSYVLNSSLAMIHIGMCNHMNEC